MELFDHDRSNAPPLEPRILDWTPPSTPDRLRAIRRRRTLLRAAVVVAVVLNLIVLADVMLTLHRVDDRLLNEAAGHAGTVSPALVACPAAN